MCLTWKATFERWDKEITWQKHFYSYWSIKSDSENSIQNYWKRIFLNGYGSNDDCECKWSRSKSKSTVESDDSSPNPDIPEPCHRCRLKKSNYKKNEIH